MKRTTCSLCAVLMLAGTAHGAFLYLENAADGSASMDLAPGESGEMNIMLYVHEIDTGGVAYALVFLESDDESLAESVPVTHLVEGLPDEFEYEEVELPTTIDHYGLIMGNGDLQAGDVVTLVTLTLTHTGTETSGSLAIIFERGARQPQLSTESFQAYIWGIGFAGIIPGFADPLVGGEDEPFMINFVPPAADCEGDANGDGIVDPLDSGFVLARFGCEVDAGDPDCDAADQNDDGEVDPLDVGYVAARFGTCG